MNTDGFAAPVIGSLSQFHELLVISAKVCTSWRDVAHEQLRINESIEQERCRRRLVLIHKIKDALSRADRMMLDEVDLGPDAQSVYAALKVCPKISTIVLGNDGILGSCKGVVHRLMYGLATCADGDDVFQATDTINVVNGRAYVAALGDMVFSLSVSGATRAVVMFGNSGSPVARCPLNAVQGGFELPLTKPMFCKQMTVETDGSRVHVVYGMVQVPILCEKWSLVGPVAIGPFDNVVKADRIRIVRPNPDSPPLEQNSSE